MGEQHQPAEGDGLPPGCSWSNPVWYRGYRIYPNDFTAHALAWTVAVEFARDDFDGAPDVNDPRAGAVSTVEKAKAEIDMIEDDA